MRSFVFLVALICLVNAQLDSSYSNPAVNPFANPSFGAGSNPSMVYPQQQPSGGPLSRIFNWFRRPGQPNQLIPSASTDDYSNSLPKESTDQMISDAIADRILEESREQQSIVGSPYISDGRQGEHESSASEKSEQIISPINRDGYGKSVANEPTDKIPIAEALRIVNSSNLTDCVARPICELSCNANAYGNPGRVVFRNLIKLQFDQNVKSDDAKSFRQAAAKGRQIVQGKRDCKECFTIYPNCNSSSKDLIAVSSMFKL